MQIISKNEAGKDTKISRAALNRAGMRITSQRALILEIMRRGRGHLDADEVYRRARARKPRLSLSTVYRTLGALKKQGLVEEVHFDDDRHYYEAKPLAEHYHMVCLDCGRVIEFRYPLARRIKQQVAEARGFEIADTEVRIAGYCPECQKKRR